MPNQIVKVLDTTVGETGVAITVPFGRMSENTPIPFTAYLGAGDTVVVEGKMQAADDYELLYSFEADGNADVYPRPLMQVRRAADGGAGDSRVEMANIFNLDVADHA